jgi:hypothetical protein
MSQERGGTEILMLDTDEVPLALGGGIKCNVQSLLRATAACLQTWRSVVQSW